jgi:hypothetical protein
LTRCEPTPRLISNKPPMESHSQLMLEATPDIDMQAPPDPNSQQIGGTLLVHHQSKVHYWYTIRDIIRE